MKMSFRWFGEDDQVTLKKIKQIPNISTIVTAIYDAPVGEVWSRERIVQLKNQVESEGLAFEVIESVPLHEDIKLGKASRDKYISNYKENIKRLGETGIKVICYNFMPVFDWTRTQLDKELADGSNALVYDADQIERMDPLTGELALPGWDTSYTKETLKQVLKDYAKVTEENLWSNLKYFLQEIIPVAESSGIMMAIHQDDPPWSIFGLPRIINCEANLDRLLSLVESKNNGLTLCSGSLGASAENDLVHLADKYSAMGRIHFVHLRNVKLLNGGFEESAHYSLCGSLDMVAIMKSLHQNGYQGYIRPDHGRMIWGETGRPGYGLYDRALGAAYLNGIWETLDKCGGKGASL